jgi:mono/diheme cytochrome c family protein
MKSHVNYLVAAAFVALVFLTIVYVTAIVPATTFVPEKTEVAVEYTAQERRGRDIYRREGCFYCHTQFVRYQDREGGEMVKAGDYVNETPHILGTERTGPDLSNIGGKYSDAWHWAHHVSPRAVKPGSIMPSFGYLTDDEMTDLIAYLQTVGRKRVQPNWIEAPQEFRDRFHVVGEKVDVSSSAAANAGRGIFMQNCSQCHGVTGRGNGPVSMTMQKKPANFTRPYYTAYDNATWFWRVSEGVPGTRMPRWRKSLSDEDIAYLVAFLKTLPRDPASGQGENTVTTYDDLDRPEEMDQNFREIEANKDPFRQYAPETFNPEGPPVAMTREAHP